MSIKLQIAGHCEVYYNIIIVISIVTPPFNPLMQIVMQLKYHISGNIKHSLIFNNGILINEVIIRTISLST